MAEFALIAWIPITMVLFARLRPAMAASIALVGATILLPNRYGFDLPGLPPMDRDRIACAAALCGCLWAAPAALRGRRPGRGVEMILVVMSVGAFVTALGNTDPVTMAGRRLPPLSWWDGVSQVGDIVLSFWIPFYLGRMLFREPRDLRTLLLVFTAAGVLYTPLVLFEVRMSPRLNLWVYGYSAAQWNQQVRSGGYRPMVFIGHGLALGMFLSTCMMAGIGMWKSRLKLWGFTTSWVGPYLYGVLLLCHSLGAQVYATVALPCQSWLSPGVQRRILYALIVVLLTYPVLRTLDWFPTESLLEGAESISHERMLSLKFRFDNEDRLLGRAQEKPLFGWGKFGRNMVYDERGRRDVVTDGFWIAQLSKWGLVGFLCAFGILLAPPFLALRAMGRRRPSPEYFMMLAVTWILVLRTVDLLPNAFLTVRAPFAAGALLGATEGWRRAERRRREQREEAPRPPEPLTTEEPPPRLSALLGGRRAR